MAVRTSRLPDPRSVDRPWLGEYPPGVPQDFPIPHVALPRLLDDAVRDFPTQPALRFDGTSTSWAELDGHVRDAARVLRDAGVATGSRVGVMLPNVPAAVVALFALWRLGATAVLLAPRASKHQRARLLQQAGAVALIGEVIDLDRLEAVSASIPGGLTLVVSHPEARGVPTRTERWRQRTRLGRAASVRPMAPAPVPVHRWALERPSRSSPPLQPLHLDPESTAVIVASASPPGGRRAVLLRHRNLVANAFQARLWLPDVRAGQERILCLPSFGTAYGLTMGLVTATLSAATMVLPPRHRELADILDLMEVERPTLVHGTAALYGAFAGDDRTAAHDLGSLRVCVSADPLPAAVVRDFEARSGGARLRGGHGLAEAGPVTHANPIYGRAVPESIGLPVTSTVAIVVDPSDATRLQRPGEPGRLAVHGPQVMEGYLGDPAGTAEVLRDGWLLTDDLVTCDDRGVFRLLKSKGLVA